MFIDFILEDTASNYTSYFKNQFLLYKGQNYNFEK